MNEIIEEIQKLKEERKEYKKNCTIKFSIMDNI